MKKGIIGNGGFGREVFWSLNQEDRQNAKFFVDDEYWTENDNTTLPLSKFNTEEYEIVVAVGDPKLRKKIMKNL